jgi:hypothetical protein
MKTSGEKHPQRDNKDRNQRRGHVAGKNPLSQNEQAADRDTHDRKGPRGPSDFGQIGNGIYRGSEDCAEGQGYLDRSEHE